MEFRSYEARKAFILFDKYFNPQDYEYSYKNGKEWYTPSRREIETKIINEKFSGELCKDLINHFGDSDYEN